MKLETFLEKLDPEMIVHLGTKDGSSFIEIGSASKIMENLDAINERLHKGLKESLERYEDRIYQLPFRIVETHRLLESGTIEDEEKLKRLKEKLRLDEIAFANYLDGRTKMRAYVDKYIPIRERAVVDNYERIHDEGIVVIIKGIELGHLWWLGEKDED